MDGGTACSPPRTETSVVARNCWDVSCSWLCPVYAIGRLRPQWRLGYHTCKIGNQRNGTSKHEQVAGHYEASPQIWRGRGCLHLCSTGSVDRALAFSMLSENLRSEVHFNSRVTSRVRLSITSKHFRSQKSARLRCLACIVTRGFQKVGPKLGTAIRRQQILGEWRAGTRLRSGTSRRLHVRTAV